MFIITIITILVKHKKYWWIEILIILSTLGLIFIVEYERVVALLQRLNINIESKVTEIANNSTNIESNTSGGNSNLNSEVIIPNEVIKTENNSLDLDFLTTGRFDIIKTYLTNLLNIPMRMLFGYGLGFDNLVIKGGSSSGLEMGPHNVYIECFYSLGIVGTILFITYLLFILYTYNKKINVISMLITLITPLIFALSLSFFSYRLFDYILFSLIASNTKNHNSEDKKDIKKE